MSETSAAARVFLRRLEVMATIGVHPHEQGRTQRIYVDVTADVDPDSAPRDDRLAETLDYQALAHAVQDLAVERHIQLVETLAERIADWCFADARVRRVHVRIEKPEALSNAAAAGCELTRTR